MFLCIKIVFLLTCITSPVCAAQDPQREKIYSDVAQSLKYSISPQYNLSPTQNKSSEEEFLAALEQQLATSDNQKSTPQPSTGPMSPLLLGEPAQKKGKEEVPHTPERQQTILEFIQETNTAPETLKPAQKKVKKKKFITEHELTDPLSLSEMPKLADIQSILQEIAVSVNAAQKNKQDAKPLSKDLRQKLVRAWEQLESFIERENQYDYFVQKYAQQIGNAIREAGIGAADLYIYLGIPNKDGMALSFDAIKQKIQSNKKFRHLLKIMSNVLAKENYDAFLHDTYTEDDKALARLRPNTQDIQQARETVAEIKKLLGM